MKIILLHDVPKVGHKHEVREVADGYATNYLIPRRLAERATDKKVAALEKHRVQAAEKASLQSKLLHEDLQKISGKTVHISAKASKQGHLFKGLHAADVARVIEEKYDVHLPEDAIRLPEPIKEVGKHTLTVAAGGEEAAVAVIVDQDA